MLVYNLEYFIKDKNELTMINDTIVEKVSHFHYLYNDIVDVMMSMLS